MNIGHEASLESSVCLSDSRAYGMRTEMPGYLCHEISTTFYYRLRGAKMAPLVCGQPQELSLLLSNFRGANEDVRVFATSIYTTIRRLMSHIPA